MASAKTIDRSAIAATSSPDSTPGADTPMNTSAPTTASFSEPVNPSWLVLSASHASSPVRSVAAAVDYPGDIGHDNIARTRGKQQLDDRGAGRTSA